MRRLRQSVSTTFVPFALALAGLTVPKPPALTAGENDAALIEQVKQALPDSPGACVLAIDGGQVILKQGFGVADVQSNEPCTPATNFRMASVSKQFTATAVLRLVDRHKLSLEDTLDKFFPGFPEYGKKITIRHLLTHTSGLPDYDALIPKGTTLQLDDLDVLHILMDAKEPLFPAGKKWEYSNSAFVLLGLIVEITANEPFQTFMQDELFKPIGMDNTVLYQRGLNEVKNRAYGHAKQNGKWVRADQSVSSATRGDGVVYTSLEDIQKWIFAHAQRKILNENSQREMFSRQVKTTRGESSYGFGWFIDEYRDTRRFHHNGDTRGFRLCVQAFPDRLAAIVLQFNGEVDEDMTKVGERLADVLIFDREQSLTTKPVTANRTQAAASP